MKILPLILLFPVLALLVGCQTTSPSTSSPAIAWTKSTGTVKIKDTLTIGSKDYAWKTVDGTDLAGDGGQAENQEPPFIMEDNARLKRVIGKEWPESVSIRGDNCIIDGLEIPDVGEDAISTYKNHPIRNLTIRNVKFAKATDKILQINEGANGVLIENGTFSEFKSAIRLKKGVKNVTIRNCRFPKGLRAVVLDPGVEKPKVENCTYGKGVTPFYQG